MNGTVIGSPVTFNEKHGETYLFGNPLEQVKEAAQFTDDVMQAMAEKLGINVMATWQIIRRCWGRLEGDMTYGPIELTVI